jgi:hypothetical protein
VSNCFVVTTSSSPIRSNRCRLRDSGSVPGDSMSLGDDESAGEGDMGELLSRSFNANW